MHHFLILPRMPDAQAAPGCRVAVLPLGQGTVCSGAVSHWFYTTGRSSHPVRGLQTSFPVCRVQLPICFWEEIFLPGCEELSLPPSFPVRSSCCRAFSSSCIISLPERPMGFIVVSLFSWIPPHCLFLLSLDSIFFYFHVGVSKHPCKEIVFYLPVLLLWLLTISSFGKFCLVWS